MSYDWNTLDKTPPDQLVEVIDKDGNTAWAQPTYYPFEIVKKPGDETKPWGLRGTVVHYENGVSKWDGGWMVKTNGLEISNIGEITGWR